MTSYVVLGKPKMVYIVMYILLYYGRGVHFRRKRYTADVHTYIFTKACEQEARAKYGGTQCFVLIIAR